MARGSVGLQLCLCFLEATAVRELQSRRAKLMVRANAESEQDKHRCLLPLQGQRGS